MSKRTQQKFLVAFEVSFLCLSLSLLPTSSVKAEQRKTPLRTFPDSGLAKQCTDAEIQANIEKLNNTNAWVSTIDALRKCGSPALRALTQALQDKNAQVRINAASALGSIGTEAASAVPALTQALQDKNAQVRSSAIYALESMGKEAVSAIPALTQALQDKDELVRDNAASVLGSMGQEAVSAVPALTQALQDKDEGVRESAASALESMGAQAASAVPALTQALQDRDREVRDSAARALSRINALKAEKEPRVQDREFAENYQYKWILIFPSYIVSLSSLWLVILWVRPVWLLRINNALKPYTDFKLPAGDRGIKLSLRFLILVGFFHYHPRVLNTWVAANIDSDKKPFQKQTTVSDLVDLKGNNVASRMPALSTFQEDAKAIAWECLKQNYRPECVKRDRALAVLASLDSGEHAELRLQYLEKRLGLIQTIGTDRDQIRFFVDLLAEYLAALYVVELYDNNEEKWRMFLARADAMPDKQPIKGFFMAVRDCCIALGTENKIPSFLLEELSQQAGLTFIGSRE